MAKGFEKVQDTVTARLMDMVKKGRSAEAWLTTKAYPLYQGLYPALKTSFAAM